MKARRRYQGGINLDANQCNKKYWQAVAKLDEVTSAFCSIMFKFIAQVKIIAEDM